MNATDTPKARSIATPGEGTIASRVAAGLGWHPSPLDDRHFNRLAIVYVRQSDPQQVLTNLGRSNTISESSLTVRSRWRLRWTYCRRAHWKSSSFA